MGRKARYFPAEKMYSLQKIYSKLWLVCPPYEKCIVGMM